MDAQTLMGKTPAGVAKLAKAQKKKWLHLQVASGKASNNVWRAACLMHVIP